MMTTEKNSKKFTAKVFGVGLHKTGTVSLRQAFRELGYKCFLIQGAWFMERLNKRGEMEFNPYSDIDQHDAYADLPIPLFYRKLDKVCPGSKFILTVRDVKTWLPSVERHLRIYGYDWYSTLPEGKLIHAYLRALYGIDRFDSEIFRKVFIKHNESVIQYFKDRPEDLLIMNLEAGDGWEKLCHFLGKPMPNTPFCHLNKSVKF